MSTSRKTLLTAAFVVVLAAFATAVFLLPERERPTRVRVVQAADVDWQALNPLRGDKSPRAGTLWGDRGAPVPCGFLVKFVDGFSSPPHIHPVTYRGLVIHGLVHNDRPDADEEWLEPGSFWTQPAGEIHITAAKGGENVAYIEIEKGPYLVHPAQDAFDRTEVPVKMAPDAMPWARAPGTPASAPQGPQVAALPGNPEDDGVRRAVLKLPAGFEGAIKSRGGALHVVVIQGAARHEVPDRSAAQTLAAGSYFGSEGKVAHRVACEAACVLYLRTKGVFDVEAASPDAPR